MESNGPAFFGQAKPRVGTYCSAAKKLDAAVETCFVK